MQKSTKFIVSSGLFLICACAGFLTTHMLKESKDNNQVHESNSILESNTTLAQNLEEEKPVKEVEEWEDNKELEEAVDSILPIDTNTTQESIQPKELTKQQITGALMKTNMIILPKGVKYIYVNANDNDENAQYQSTIQDNIGNGWKSVECIDRKYVDGVLKTVTLRIEHDEQYDLN